MRSKELQTEVVSTFRGRSASDVDQRFRILREVLSEERGEKRAPRGVNAPHLLPAEVAMHVMALIAKRPGDLVHVLPRLEACRYVEHPLFLSAGDDFRRSGAILPTPGMSLRDAIVMATVGATPGWQNLEIMEDGDLAWLSVRESRLHFGARLLFSVDAESVAATIDEEAEELLAHDPVLDPVNAKRFAYERLDRTRGSRFVVNALDLFWMGHRAWMQHPELGGSRQEVASCNSATQILAAFKRLNRRLDSISAVLRDSRIDPAAAKQLTDDLDLVLQQLVQAKAAMTETKTAEGTGEVVK